MSIPLKVKKTRKLNRVLSILLVAFCAVEGFFLWLILFPNTEESSANVDNGVSELISDTRDIDISETIKIYERRYRLEDWQQFENELKERYSGKNYAIAFSDLNDPDLTLSVNADQEFMAASTYKLFAAYSMFKSGDPPECLDTMIIDSDNDCPVAYMEDYGWSNLTKDAKEIGAENTYFDTTAHTTANDLVTILHQIYDGTLLSEEDNNRLLNDMKQQIYRGGIPTGVPETEVADKVGFLDGLLHDAGIVYSPKDDFILVVLTDGYSWDSIAKTTTEIYNHL